MKRLTINRLIVACVLNAIAPGSGALATPSFGSLYPIVSLANSGDAATANFSATSFAHLPVGAAGWDAATSSNVILNASDKYADSGLTATYNTSNPSGNKNIRGNTAGAAGRYFEAKIIQVGNGNGQTIGLGLANLTQSLTSYPGDPNSAAWFGSGYAEWPGSGFSDSWSSFTNGDLIGIYLKTSSVDFYKNGILVGTAVALPSGTLYPIVSLANNGDSVTVNFGDTPYSYLPSGAAAWDPLATATTSGSTPRPAGDLFAMAIA